MPEPIDFAGLTLMDALDLGMLIEDEAKERYEEFAEQLELHHTTEAARFFRHMVTNETKHGQELAQRRTALFGNAPARVTRAMLWDIEAPEYDQARVFMSLRQALQVALDAEIKAFGFFNDALQHVKNPEVRKLFEELRDEELEHQDLVKKEMDKVPPAPDIDPDGFVDEPVGH